MNQLPESDPVFPAPGAPNFSLHSTRSLTQNPAQVLDDIAARGSAAQVLPAPHLAPSANEPHGGGLPRVHSPSLPPGVRRWLLWKSVPSIDPTKKDRKVAYYANGATRGATDTPDDWAQLVTWDEAQEAFRRGSYTGFGFALGPDGTGSVWQGFDADNVPPDRLNATLTGLPGYVEVSPSGRGIHAIGYGRSFATLGSNGSGLEAYCAGRFFTVTGDRARGAVCCIADFVETAVAPGHARANAKAGSSCAAQPAHRLDDRTYADLRSALNAIPCEDRSVWVSVGMALKTLGDAPGYELWATWSQRSAKWDPVDGGRVWDSLDPKETSYQAVFVRAEAFGWLNTMRRIDASTPALEWQNGDWHLASPAARPRPPDALVMRTADTIEMQVIDWTWPGYIACSFLNLLVGETAAGKSTVIADVAARVTTGRAWPGEDVSMLRHPGRVLWLGSEDPMELLTVPRLRACGANLQFVTEIQGVTRMGERNTFSMQDDLSMVRLEIARAHKEGGPYAMLVIDPITSYLHGGKLKKVDMNDSGHLRTVLEPWTQLAKDTGIAIVGVTHLAKDTTRSLLHRVLGGGAFAHLCRSLIAVVNLPDQGLFAKAVLQVKSNLPGIARGAWRFHTELATVGQDKFGRPVEATFPYWDGLDPGITPERLAGGARGPVSKYPAVFGLWLRSRFFNTPENEGQRVSDVRAAALGDEVVTARWWDEHSGEYLDKQNVGGVWMCRPKKI